MMMMQTTPTMMNMMMMRKIPWKIPLEENSVENSTLQKFILPAEKQLDSLFKLYVSNDITVANTGLWNSFGTDDFLQSFLTLSTTYYNNKRPRTQNKYNVM